MRNGVWSRRKCPPLLSTPTLVLSQTTYRLISRFFLNLRAICYYGKSTATSQTAVSTVSPIPSHAFWRRPRQFTTIFSFGLGAETRIYGGLATQNERGIPRTEAVDLDIGMELRARKDEDKDGIQLDADVVTMYEK